MSLPEEISVAELKRMHDENEPLLLLDVREDDEVATASVDFAKHVPMAAVPQRLEELPKDRPIVVMCHGGTRSGRVTRYLRENGFGNATNLAGGIDDWSVQIDPSVPRY
jgi:rhodanese-related sulfurtransferase